ncbi:DUF4097 family beta strand repeat-containing protein [Luteipulveratus halotolerans]|uniref:DUF4097 domain-containing protein n=1 Tax=Luteipulveratus halotolerans TaxID=1631356 RepID=A0A0L6CF59_9MICO|nr:DUF4097 family beta strand repeat-containing protein [Luteipulveratus halotolerans]KNX36334.1 hypothetical protein VV01_02980 [Luteipulveratus halotolerans]
MQEFTFETPEPAELSVEIGSGQVDVTADEVATSQVTVDGPGADDVTVTQEGRRIVVKSHKRSGLFSRHERVDVTVVVPTGSDLVVRTGSGDVRTSGRFGQGALTTGSGDVEASQFAGDVVSTAGSGDIRIAEVGGALRGKSGSGGVRIGRVAGAADISSGSGDLAIDGCGTESSFKTGSGNVAIGDTTQRVTVTTASGDVSVQGLRGGAVKIRTASGDVAIALAEGVPVWADINTVSGTVHRDIASAGEPTEGQAHIELHILTASGRIDLRHI